MSAGVSDQRMKGQGNQVNSSNKNVETDNRTSIPWSQQVDEAYENLSSPTEGNQSGSYDSSNGGGGTQFQYPPFNAKESGAWSGNKSSSRRYSPSNNENYDNNDGNKRMYNQSFNQQHQQQQHSSYNFFSRNGDTSWAAQVNAAHQQQQQQQQQQQSNSRRSNNYDDYYNRSDRNNHQNDNFKSIQRGMQNMVLENNENRSTTGSTLSNSSAATNAAAKAKSTTQTATVPKKMTWASIASQPAKPTLRISSTSSTLKKKGPGMPPPPMVPGKHNMDIGTWDSPKNGPILVPPSPPPVIPVPIMEPSPLSQTKSSGPSSSSNNNSNNNNNDVISSSKVDQAPSHLQNQKSSRSGGSNNQMISDSNQSSSDTRPANQNIRPPWISQNNPPPKSGGNEGGSRYIPTHHQYQRPNSQQHQGQGGAGPGGGGNRQESNIGDRYHRENDSENFRRGMSGNNSSHSQQHSAYPPVVASPTLSNSSSNHPVLEELQVKNNYNPPEIDLQKASLARFFVIKSYSEDDIHRSIKYEIWCSTEHGNKRLDEAFKERESEGGIVYLFFSVNRSGHFCGMAQMMTPVDYNSVSNVWSQDKWKGKFKVKWIYVKDVPNKQLRQIRLENNENRSVTHSRDTQEVPNAKGIQVLKILHSYRHTTSIFDDFIHYEKMQEEANSKKYEPNPPPPPPPPPPLPHDNSSRGSGNRGIYRGGDYERNAGGDSLDKGYYGGFRDRNQNRGSGYHNFENRRNDDYRGYSGGTDRIQRGDGQFRDNGRDGGRGEGRDAGNGGGRDNRENSGDFHNNRGFHRGGGGGGSEFGRRDDRGYNNRDRSDNYNDGNNHSGGFMSRGGGDSASGRNIGGGGGGFRDNFNRDRDFHSRGRVRGEAHRN